MDNALGLYSATPSITVTSTPLLSLQKKIHCCTKRPFFIKSDNHKKRCFITVCATCVKSLINKFIIANKGFPMLTVGQQKYV